MDSVACHRKILRGFARSNVVVNYYTDFKVCLRAEIRLKSEISEEERVAAESHEDAAGEIAKERLMP